MSAMSIRMLSVFAVTVPLFTVLTGAASAQMALPGSFAVTEGGAATYEIPIEVPPGTAGVEPKLSLTYSSNGGNGLLGVGWALSGLSQISRCARTVATDGQHGGVNYDANDRFCLNGDRLVAISGTYGADGTEYRTQSEGFSRIISHGTAGNGPASFTVWTKAGLKMAFGVTADSRIEAQGKTTVRLWALSQVTDTAGNYMTVTYTEEPVDGSYRPDRIDYTGNTAEILTPFASVNFEYEARTDAISHYRAGSLVSQRQLLRAIKTHLNGTHISTINIIYSTGGNYSDDMVESVERCDSTSGCLSKSHFGSNTVSVEFNVSTNLENQNGVLSGYRSLIGDFNGDGRDDIFWYSSDQFGNSLGSHRLWLTTSNGGYFFNNDVAGQNSLSTGLGFRPLIGDFNGDGVSDIFMYRSDNQGRSTGTHRVWLNSGDGLSFFILNNIAGQNGSYVGFQPMLADFNGDGITDIFLYWSDDAGLSRGMHRIWINQGDGFSYSIVTNVAGQDGSYVGFRPMLADFNADGAVDIFLYWSDEFGLSRGMHRIWMNDGDAYSFSIVVNVAGQDGSYVGFRPLVADVNGDGLSDIFLYWSDIYGRSRGMHRIWVNQGSGSLYKIVVNVAGQDGSYVGFQPRLVDFNGDGSAEIFLYWSDIYGRSLGMHRIWINHGDSSSYDILNNVAGQDGSYQTWVPQFLDADGDGLADIFFESTEIDGRSAGYRDVWYSGEETSGRLLTSVSNGLGSTSRIEYASLAASGAPYTKDSGVDAASYPGMDLQAPAHVASEVRADDGLGGVTTTRYRYGGLKYDHELRQTLGFRWREVEQVETGVVKRTEYRQDFPYIGRASKAETRVSNTAQGNGGLVRSSESQYLCEDFAGSAGCEVQPGRRYFVYQNQSIEKGWDIDGTALPETTTTSTYDSYGNATGVNVSVFDPATSQTFTKTTTNTYVNPGYSPANDTWILGRLTRAEVTSTSP